MYILFIVCTHRIVLIVTPFQAAQGGLSFASTDLQLETVCARKQQLELWSSTHGSISSVARVPWVKDEHALSAVRPLQ